MSGVRPVLVVDGDGEWVGSFPGWEPAYEWARLRATEAAGQSGARLPVRVEDLAGRRTWEVWPDRSELIVWAAWSRSSHVRPAAGRGVAG